MKVKLQCMKTYEIQRHPKRDIYGYIYTVQPIFFLKKQQQKESIMGMDLKTLEKQEQIELKSSRQEEIKIAEINEMRKQQATRNQGWQDDLVGYTNLKT